MPRKSNVSKVVRAGAEIDVEITPMEAQQIVNICVRLGVGFIKKMVKPKSVRDLLQAYFKSLEPTGMFAGVTDEIYEINQRQKNETRKPGEKGIQRLKFNPAKRQASEEE